MFERMNNNPNADDAPDALEFVENVNERIALLERIVRMQQEAILALARGEPIDLEKPTTH
jgi:hypothetical protein